MKPAGGIQLPEMCLLMRALNKSAFTMIELVMILAALGILAGVAGVRMQNRSIQFSVSVSTLVSQLEYAKLAAVQSKQITGYVFDTKNQTYTGTVISKNTANESPFSYEPYVFQLVTSQIKLNAPQKKCYLINMDCR